MLALENHSDLHRISPVSLAFLGDGVYELLVREEIIRRFVTLPARKLHSFTVKMVCAKAQAKAFLILEPLLTEEETAVFRRGRNATGVTPPRHTDAADYRTATGVEALFGWLYMNGRKERIQELFGEVLKHEEEVK